MSGYFHPLSSRFTVRCLSTDTHLPFILSQRRHTRALKAFWCFHSCQWAVQNKSNWSMVAKNSLSTSLSSSALHGTSVQNVYIKSKKRLLIQSQTWKMLHIFVLGYTNFLIYVQNNSTYPDAGYTDRPGHSGTHFLAVIVLHLFMA